MPSYSKNDVILVRYPFSDLSGAKVRPAVVVAAPHPSQDTLIVPLTSAMGRLMGGEFALSDWSSAGLNVPTAVKRGIYTVHSTLVASRLRQLSTRDADQLEQALRMWLGLP